MSTSSVAVQRRPVWGLWLIAVFLIGLFLPTLIQLVRIWGLDDNYSHGYYILPISLWLAWQVWRTHPVPAAGNATAGGILMGMGLVTHLVCVVLRYPPIDFVALMLVLRGVAVTLGGTAWANHYLFPTLFLFFLFPLPQDMTTWLAVTLQDVVTPICVEIFGWFYDCYRRGNAIHISPATDLYVAQACSGVRQLMAFIAMGALVSYLGNVSWPRGLLLMLLSVPVAIFANVVRVLMMGVAMVRFGNNWLSTWLHDMPGFFTIILGIVTMFALMWVISPDPRRQMKEVAK